MRLGVEGVAVAHFGDDPGIPDGGDGAIEVIGEFPVLDHSSGLVANDNLCFEATDPIARDLEGDDDIAEIDFGIRSAGNRSA